MTRRSIETGVVSLEFDTKAFVLGIQNALRNLASLQEALKLEGAARGISQIDQAMNSVRFANMESALDSISDKFSVMGVIAATIISRITSAFMDMASTFMNTAIFEPMIQGYQEYEMQIGAIQTILANTKSKGTVLDDVMEALNDLNDFSDKTIFNFAQMVTSIGAFTTAGVDLATSVDAIKGISGLAAISGATSEKMSNAMYMISQAVNTGRVMTRHWQSLTISGMGGEIFQQEIMRTARIHGIAIDEMVEKQGGFRNTLESGWLTSEILLDTLAKFSGDVTEDQLRAIGYTEDAIAEILELGEMAMAAATNIKTFSQFQTVLRESIATGWTTTAVMIVGDFEEAVDMYTRINSVLSASIAKSAENRNKQLAFWKAAGGREMMIEALLNTMTGAIDLSERFKAAMQEIFPPIRAGNLLAISALVLKISQSFKMGEDSGKQFHSIIRGIASALDILRNLALAVLKPIGDAIKSLSAGSGQLFDFLAGIGDFVTGLRSAIITTDFFNEVIGRIVRFIQPVVGLVGLLVQEFLRFDLIRDIMRAFGGLGNANLVGFFQVILQVLDNTLDGIGRFLGSVMQFSQVQSIIASVARGVGSAIDIVRLFVLALIEPITKLAAGLVVGLVYVGAAILETIGRIADFVSKLRNALVATNFFSELISRLSRYLEPVIGLIARLAVGIGKLSIIQRIAQYFDELGEDKIARFLQGILDTMDRAEAGIKIFIGTFAEFINKVAGSESVTRFREWLKSFDGSGIREFVSVAISEFQSLSSFLQKIGSRLFGGLFESLKNLDASTIFSGIDKALNKLGDFISNAGLTMDWEKFFGIIKIGLGLWVAKEGVGLLSTLRGFLGGGLAGLLSSAIFGPGGGSELSSMIKSTFGAIETTMVNFQNNLKADTLMKIAVAIGILVGSLLVLSLIDNVKLAVGVAAMAALSAQLVTVTALLAKIPTVTLIKSTGALLLMAGALAVMVGALFLLSLINSEKLVTGMATMTLALLQLVVVSRTMGRGGPGIERASIATLILSIAMTKLAKSIETFGKMDFKTMIQGLLGVASALFIFAGFSQLVRGPQLIAASIGVAALSGALVILSVAVRRFSDIPWDAQIRGLMGMGIALGILAVAMKAMSGSLLGAAALVVVSGALVVLAGAMKTLSSISWEGLAIALAAIAGVLVIFGLAGAVLGPVVPILLGLGAAMLLIGLSAGAVGVGIFAAAAGLVALGVAAPVVAAGITLIAGAVMVLLPRLAAAIATSMVIFLETLAEAAPRLYTAAVNLMVNFLAAVEEAFPRIVNSIFSLIQTMLITLAKAIPDFVTSGIELLMALLKGVADNIKNVVAMGLEIVVNFLAGIAEKMEDIIKTGLEVVTKFIKGLTDGLPDLIKATFEFILAWINAMSEAIDEYAPELGEALGRLGASIVTGLVAAVVAGLPQVVAAAASLAQAAIDAIRERLRSDSPSKETMDLGDSAVDGLLLPLVKRTKEVKSKFGNLIKVAKAGIEEAILDMNVTEFDDIFRPTIQPVMDLSLVNAGLRDFGRGLLQPSLVTLAAFDSKSEDAGVTDTSQEPGSQYTFIQHNTSPKPLTTGEIYRRTESLISRHRRLGIQSAF